MSNTQRYQMRVLVAPGVTATDDRTPAEIDATARLLDAAAYAEEVFSVDDLEAWAAALRGAKLDGADLTE